MTRWLQISSIVLAGLAALGVFQIKFRAESIADRVAKAERRLAEEKEMVSLLRAEWSYLIQPGRIQALAERHYQQLQLQPLEAGQIGTLDSLPAKPVAVETISSDVRAPLRRPDQGAGQ